MRKAVLFDLDGTLAETAPDIVVAFNKGLTAFGHQEVEYEYGRSLVGHGGRDMYERHFRSNGLEVHNHDLSSIMDVFFQHYLEESGKRATVYDGVVSMLNRLKDADFALAVVTNKREQFTEVTLNRLGINRFFDAVVCGDTLPDLKPHPSMLSHAIDLVESNHESAVMIGDTANDVIPSVELGIPCFTTSLGYSHGDNLMNHGAKIMTDDFYELAAAVYDHFGMD